MTTLQLNTNFRFHYSESSYQRLSKLFSPAESLISSSKRGVVPVLAVSSQLVARHPFTSNP